HATAPASPRISLSGNNLTSPREPAPHSQTNPPAPRNSPLKMYPQQHEPYFLKRNSVPPFYPVPLLPVFASLPPVAAVPLLRGEAAPPGSNSRTAPPPRKALCPGCLPRLPGSGIRRHRRSSPALSRIAPPPRPPSASRPGSRLHS